MKVFFILNFKNPRYYIENNSYVMTNKIILSLLLLGFLLIVQIILSDKRKRKSIQKRHIDDEE